jgi:hypothetical protein
MAAQIVLMDRKSHTIPFGGKEWSFELNKPRFITVPELIRYCKSAPVGMFSVTDVVEAQKAPPAPAVKAAEAPAPKEEDPEPSTEEGGEDPPPARSPRRRKVKLGDE